MEFCTAAAADAVFTNTFLVFPLASSAVMILSVGQRMCVYEFTSFWSQNFSSMLFIFSINWHRLLT
jgi:hypothetical protein